MMTLYEKIKLLFPALSDADFDFVQGSISLQDDSDGKCPYIRKWDHPSFAKPTIDQLAQAQKSVA